jgi:NAD-dependent SIR2 family protein deacetylase
MGLQPDMSTALIIGSGISVDAGLPTTREITDGFLETPIGPGYDIDAAVTSALETFWTATFAFAPGSSPPTLEDHFTALDLAANTGRQLGTSYPPIKLRAATLRREDA